MQWLANMDAITNTALPRGSPPLTNNRVSNSNCKTFWALNLRDLGIYSKQDVFLQLHNMNCVTFGQKVWKKSPIISITKAEVGVLVAPQWLLPHKVTLSSLPVKPITRVRLRKRRQSHCYTAWHCKGPKLLVSTETIWKWGLLFWKEETAW